MSVADAEPHRADLDPVCGLMVVGVAVYALYGYRFRARPAPRGRGDAATVGVRSRSPAEADQMQAGSGEVVSRQAVSAVDDEIAAHDPSQPGGVDEAEFRPFGGQDDGIGPVGRRVDVVGQPDVLELLGSALTTGSKADTTAPAAISRRAMSKAGASRKSSVSGLKASPSSAMRRPLSECNCVEVCVPRPPAAPH